MIFIIVLTIGIIILFFSLLSLFILNIKNKIFQKKIDNEEISLLSSLHVKDLHSIKNFSDKIEDRISYIEKIDQFKDYTSEINSYNEYFDIISPSMTVEQELSFEKLINLLEEKTEEFFVYKKINEYKPNDEVLSDDINDLIDIYKEKEKRVIELINKKFPAPMLANDKFLSNIDRWHEVFIKNSDKIDMLLNLSKEDITSYQEEINLKLSLLKDIIKKMGQMEAELIISLDTDQTDNENIKESIDDMVKFINSISKYK